MAKRKSHHFVLIGVMGEEERENREIKTRAEAIAAAVEHAKSEPLGKASLIECPPNGQPCELIVYADGRVDE